MSVESTTATGQPDVRHVGTGGICVLVVGRDSYSAYNLPESGTVTIGRGEGNQIRIDDPLASRKHACLVLGKTLILEDLGSVNGTRVKERTLSRGERTVVVPGDTIAIGACVLIIQKRTDERPPLLRPETLRDDDPPPPIPAGGDDVEMQRIYKLAERAAAGTINVLILGETGVGKELLGETVHKLSPRRDQAYVCLNCAALSENLLESELFGYEKGAFTGAYQSKPGLLETAGGGSVFLDEVGELPLATQAKLLRVIETREVSRIGSLRPRKIDVRFIAATNRDLEEEVKRGSFRRDLYFRLNGISLTIPPLRERVSEIRRLAELFVGNICRELRRPRPALSPAALLRLETYSWPGNIRELKNVMERAVLLCVGPQIDLEHLPAEKMSATSASVSSGVFEVPTDLAAAAAAVAPAAVGARAPEQDDERRRILEALAACAGNQSRAARMLGIPRRTFVSKLDAYRIPRPKKQVDDL